MDSRIRISRYRFRNFIFKKHDVSVFYTYSKDILTQQLFYIFIEGKSFLQKDFKDITSMNSLIAIPFFFTMKLYNINFEHEFICIHSNQFFKWLSLFQKWNILKKNKRKNPMDYFNYLKSHKLVFVVL